MKIILISFISLFLSLFSQLSNPIYDENVSSFIKSCEQGYDSYHIIYEEETINYKLLIIEGEYNEEVTYSIMFVSNTPNAYKLALRKNDLQQYINLDENKRGDALIYNLSITQMLSVDVLDKGICTFTYVINKSSLELYKLQSDLIMGENKGFDEIQEGGYQTPPITKVLSIVFLGIIFVSIIIILILFKLKKGLFNQEILDKEFEEQHQKRDEINNIIKEHEIIEVQGEEVTEEPKEVYEKVKFIDEETTRDISILLKEKGFNTNYNMLLTHEKNEIMLELMKMKDFKEITEEEYKQEIIKLWM